MPISKDKQWIKGRNKHLSGFCNDVNKPAQHEGTKAKSGDVPLPTCPFWEECPGECHKTVDMLFEATGMERQEMPNPEYIPDHGDFLPPLVADPIGLADASTVDGVMTPPDDQRPVDTPSVAAATPLAQRRTDTGRAARGGLEAQVWDALQNIKGEATTPKLVGEWIAEKYKIPTPSSGAINAVWDRWTRIGFCEQAKKPNRFLKFTSTGTWEELMRLKQSGKLQKRIGATKERLSIRTPERRKR